MSDSDTLLDNESLAEMQVITRDCRTEFDCDFRILCDRSLAGIYVYQDGLLKYANAALADLLNRPSAEIIDSPAIQFVHPDDQEHVEEQIRQRLNGEWETSRYVARFLCANGRVAVVEILGSRLPYGGKPALMGAVIDVTRQKHAEAVMEERLRFEQLLADLSASFVNLPADRIDAQIEKSLQSLVEFLGNDRSTLVEFGDDADHVLVTHSYAVNEFVPFPVGALATNRFPWFIGQFQSGKTVFLKKLPDELPPEAKNEIEYCRAHGLRSNVTVPLAVGGKILGGITFAFTRRNCEWPHEIISRLQLIGQVFANAIIRRRTEEALRVAQDENEKLRRQLEHENLYLREQVILNHQHGRFIGRSEPIVRVLSAAERVATTDAPVLLLGETGTGKELMAQSIHELSERRSRSMVVVNCASLPSTLIENELFGREAGAYTGAASAQLGRFALADCSTLFLDEIGELPIELQAKFLRVLEDGRFERIGSPRTVSVDVRIIAATNRDLRQAVKEGTFRADVYHRLNVFPIYLPALRERKEDIPQLVWAFVETFGKRMGKSIKSIPRRLMQQLQEYPWPGNVRELRNMVERAMILANNEVLEIDLPFERIDQPIKTLSENFKEQEREQIFRVLAETGWRIRGKHGAAEVLGIKPTTLEARMARFGIRRPNDNSSNP